MALNVLPLSGISDVRLIARCCNKKNIKKMPEMAMRIFFTIDEYIFRFYIIDLKFKSQKNIKQHIW